MRRLRVLNLFLCFFVCAALPARAQQVIDLDALTDESLLKSGIGNIVPIGSLFALSPGLRTGSVRVDASVLGDLELNLYKVPLSHEFEPVWRGLGPYVQFTVGGFNSDKAFVLPILPLTPTRGEIELSGFAAIGGLGVSIPITGHTALRPLAMAGYAQVTSEGSFAGPFSALLLRLADGVVLNAEADAWVFGGSIEMLHSQRFSGGYGVDGSLRVGFLTAKARNASFVDLDDRGYLPSLSAQFEVDGPTGYTLEGRSIQWQSSVASNYVPGPTGGFLGTPAALELGAGLAIPLFNAKAVTEGATLRASMLLGDGAIGWTIGLSLEY
ncbi:MAG: hypothetical protein AAFR94_06530 [Pseudomonadota bacterium]